MPRGALCWITAPTIGSLKPTSSADVATTILAPWIDARVLRRSATDDEASIERMADVLADPPRWPSTSRTAASGRPRGDSRAEFELGVGPAENRVGLRVAQVVK